MEDKKSFLLAATGLLKEAQDELRGVSGGSLPKELLVDYYGQMLYLYSHFNQYTGSEMAICMNIMHSWNVFTKTP